MSLSVLAFTSIDTVNLKFTADYYLNLRWYDLRIDFRDLNEVTALNALSIEDMVRSINSFFKSKIPSSPQLMTSFSFISEGALEPTVDLCECTWAISNSG